jgi:hypothetical protein
MYVVWFGISDKRTTVDFDSRSVSEGTTDTQPRATFFFGRGTTTISRGVRGRDSSSVSSTGDDEVMEEQSETTMDQTQGTFITDTTDPTVNGTRTTSKPQEVSSLMRMY